MYVDGSFISPSLHLFSTLSAITVSLSNQSVIYWSVIYLVTYIVHMKQYFVEKKVSVFTYANMKVKCFLNLDLEFSLLLTQSLKY